MHEPATNRGHCSWRDGKRVMVWASNSNFDQRLKQQTATSTLPRTGTLTCCVRETCCPSVQQVVGTRPSSGTTLGQVNNPRYPDLHHTGQHEHVLPAPGQQASTTNRHSRPHTTAARIRGRPAARRPLHFRNTTGASQTHSTHEIAPQARGPEPIGAQVSQQEHTRLLCRVCRCLGWLSAVPVTSMWPGSQHKRSRPAAIYTV